MKTITLGSDQSNDICIPDRTISPRKHLTLGVIESGDIVIEHHGENDSKINGRSFKKTPINPLDEVVLGNYVIKGSDLIKRVKRVVFRTKQDLSDEFEVLLNRLERYEELKAKIDREFVSPMVVRLVIICLGIWMMPAISSDYDLTKDLSYLLFCAAGTLATILFSVLRVKKRRQRKKDKLDIEYLDELVCPKCGYKLMSQSSYAWRERGACFGENCDAYYKLD